MKIVVLALSLSLLCTGCAGLRSSAVLPPEAQKTFERGVAFDEVGEPEKAMDVWMPLARAGHAEAQFRIGVLYYNQKDMPAALRWFKKAAAQNMDFALFSLGYIYFNGVESVRRDRNRGLACLEKSAALRNGIAMRELGIIYSNDSDPAYDPAKAFLWLDIAVTDSQGLHGYTRMNTLKALEILLGQMNEQHKARALRALVRREGKGALALLDPELIEPFKKVARLEMADHDRVVAERERRKEDYRKRKADAPAGASIEP